MRVAEGYLYSPSGKPIEGATIFFENYDWGDTVSSNERGHFENSIISGGFDCPALEVRITHPEFQLLLVSDMRGDTLIMQP